MEREFKFINKELKGEESWHQVVKVVLEGARRRELDRVIILKRRTENNVLMGEQMLKGSDMLGRNSKYKEDMFMFKSALMSQARSLNQCTSEESVE